MTTTQNFAAKAAVAFVAIAMAFTLVAPSAKAQDVSSMSLEQLVALVNQLQAQLSGSVSTSSTCSYTFTRSLGQGSTGADVMNLQKFLNSDPDLVVALSGAGSPGMETSFYGPATAAAVSKFQTKYSASVLVPVGLSTPTGYFGPSSMAKANALCDGTSTPTGPGTGNSGDLEGGAGSLEDADFISSLNNEDVGEDQEDVEVAGLELEADENSDLRIVAVSVEFNDDGDNVDFDDVASEVSIWFDGENVGSVEVDDMSESNGTWSETITLDNGAIIRAGEMADLVVAVSAQGNLDSTDITNGDWSVNFESVRYVDAMGAVITDTTTGDIGAETRSFEFATFASANDVELSINEASNNPSAGTVEVEDAGDEATLLIGELEAEGSDIELKELRVAIDPTSSSSEDIASEYLLMIDGEEVSSVDSTDNTGTDADSSTDGTSVTYIFEDIETVIEEGDTVEFEVVAVLNEVGTDFPEGDSLTATVTADSTNVDAEDESGEDLGNDEISGGATGELISLRSEGISIALDTSSANSTTVDPVASSYGTFKMTVEVTAVGETMYIPETSSSTTNTTGARWDLETAAGASYTSGTSTHSFQHVSGGAFSGSYVRINDGQTATFELTVTLDPAAAGQYRLVLDGIGYNATSATTPNEFETALPVTDFRTGTTNILN